nr:MAG TPA: hypothetical protein [Caudoviricetes sp.]
MIKPSQAEHRSGRRHLDNRISAPYNDSMR